MQVGNLYLLVGQCPKDKELFNTTSLLNACASIQAFLGLGVKQFLATDWAPVCLAELPFLHR